MCSPTRQQSGDMMLAQLLCLGEVQLELGEKVFPKPFYFGNFFPPESVAAENIDDVCGLKTLMAFVG